MIILDTNVISELMRPKPDRRVEDWSKAQPQSALFTTVICQAEVLYGVEVAPESKCRQQLREAAQLLFSRVMAGRVLAFDIAAAEEFYRIAAHRRKMGRPISHPDAQIAAIARREDATLATRNVRDFESCGIRLINPWTGSSGSRERDATLG
jgi:predicted nucleic acid-binding protein